ncbi:MAG: hypothetical protein EAX95_09150 [Candidatus Thorarchaeota archaeon]|nr:hypothetical protein [Candidatus Thorarchaeota archaeon]
MKVKLKIESQWLELERRSMSKLQEDYEAWEKDTLEKAKQARDLRDLREIFYKLGEGWEWDQTAGAWLAQGSPLDAVGFVLRMPGLNPRKVRFTVYTVLAYSKGFTQKFDHLGDKERVIIEVDQVSGNILGWSTAGHGSMDLFPVDLSQFSDFSEVLKTCYLVAQPGDHALRLDNPAVKGFLPRLAASLWTIAGGGLSFTSKDIEVLGIAEIEEALDFRFSAYAKAVVNLERLWKELAGGPLAKAKEVVVDKIPNHIENKNKRLLRKVEGLLYCLWFVPPAKQLRHARKVLDEFDSDPTPTEFQRTLIPHLSELVNSLTEIIERAKYLKWKSVIEQKEYSDSDFFKDLNITPFAKEALAAALDDILREHALSHIGYPEKATARAKITRTLIGVFILPYRLIMSFKEWLKSKVTRIAGWKQVPKLADSSNQEIDANEEE